MTIMAEYPRPPKISREAGIRRLFRLIDTRVFITRFNLSPPDGSFVYSIHFSPSLLLSLSLFFFFNQSYIHLVGTNVDRGRRIAGVADNPRINHGLGGT